MPTTIPGLTVIDLLGVFYREDGHLMVADEFEGATDVEKKLESLMGQEVRLIAHHRPPEPHDTNRWGGGSCLLENTGTCHWGHHDQPKSLFTFNSGGVLSVEGEKWFIEKEGEKTEMLTEFLIAHRSQIVVTSIPDLDQIDEKIRSFDPSKLENANIDDLSEQLKQMRDYLEELNRLQKNVDV